ncbi:MAG: phosphatase PAP2 family protein [Candidatus Berkelbacteria bacterium]|nr:phosphatase PAP2 family protein [Candidatus Berkelbacteria bacterium]
MDILTIDQNLLEALNRFFIGQSSAVDGLFKFFGVYFIYTLPVILLVMWFLIKDRQKRIALVMSMVSLVISIFGFNKLISHFWYRARPDIIVIGLKEVFFHRPDFSFPSDHASALFAITFTLYLFGYKKAANWFLLYSLIIVFARVVIAVHYPLDIIGGAAVALAASLVVFWLKKPLTKYIYEPIVFVLKKVRLA